MSLFRSSSLAFGLDKKLHLRHHHSAVADAIEAELMIEYQRAVVYSPLPHLEMDLAH